MAGQARVFNAWIEGREYAPLEGRAIQRARWSPETRTREGWPHACTYIWDENLNIRS